MKSVICTKYGTPDVLQIKELEKPVPKDNEVLIRIYATPVTSGDARIRRADPFIIRLIFGFKKPRQPVLGVVLSGEIESIGKKVTQFKEGDKVFGTTGMSFGAYAQYKCIPEDGVLALKPENMTYEEAAAIPFGATAALDFLKKGNIHSYTNGSDRKKVLIYGASGDLGSIGVQLAKYYGAEVTAVCSTSNIEFVKSLGADKVIDYIKEDFAQNGIKYDIIFETVGKSDYSGCIKSLTNNGTLMLANGGLSLMLKGIWTSVFTNKKVIAGVIKERAEDLIFFKELIESGKLKAVIDRQYPLEQISEAHAYVDKGHKKGSVVVTI